MRTYIKAECAWFYSSKDLFFELSNMAAGFPISYGGNVWRSSEHLYQASKYAKDVECLPADSKSTIKNVRLRILDAKNPMASKMTQKCAVSAGLVRPDWQYVNIQNMLFVLQLKVYCNPHIKRFFKGTGDRDIVEISRKDTFWGCRDQYRSTGNVLIGENNLGILLMQVRDNIDAIIAGDFVEPDKFFID